ncbi:MAG: hypothetical protein B6241_01650 [Spirochaetaceae bacterium 4572_59]|nr:MAG: hypothetical protein B6241_01650 [Spirochaetaceae bacterium 4572_59]
MKGSGKEIFRCIIFCLTVLTLTACSDRYPYFFQKPEFYAYTVDGDSSGIYLNITSPDGESLIRYTTNGSNPSSSYGELYEDTLYLTTSTYIRACAYRSGYSAGPIAEYYYEATTE